MFAASTISQWVVLAVIVALLLRVSLGNMALHRAALARTIARGAGNPTRALAPASLPFLPGFESRLPSAPRERSAEIS